MAAHADVQDGELLTQHQILEQEAPTRAQEANQRSEAQAMNRNMARSYNRTGAGGRPCYLISQSARVLATHKEVN